MPSALAVFRSMTSSYIVGACTGRSAGFSPLRMRSTSPPRVDIDRRGFGGHLRRRAAQPYVSIRFSPPDAISVSPTCLCWSFGGQESKARRSPQGEDGNRNAGHMECEKCGLGCGLSRLR
jgi:hypothetical protein